MRTVLDDGQVTLLQGHVMECLRSLPAESVQLCVTSPPYWNLRAYGTEPQVWGGADDCDHDWVVKDRLRQSGGDGTASKKQVSNAGSQLAKVVGQVSDCSKCGAWRGELGHEPTPGMFVAHLVEVFREVRRVLKPDGVCFVNLGDSYAGSGKGPSSKNGLTKQHSNVGSLVGPTPVGRYSGKHGRGRDAENTLERRHHSVNEKASYQAPDGTKPKDLVLIPERFVLAMQDDGWYVRSRIAWCKKAPMPESVNDRPTTAWEPIWMFAKSAHYFWDMEAVKETLQESSIERGYAKAYMDGAEHRKATLAGDDVRAKENWRANPYIPTGRNMWSYWLLSPDPEPLAHFATFPRELPRRCIAAATSEKGECPQCGKAWARVVERVETGRMHKLPSGMATYDGNHGSIHKDGRELTPTYNPETVARTTGWEPSCKCAVDPVSSIVLDPFVGSGTTTLVARQMGRRGIGIDLSDEYLDEIAFKKNAQMAFEGL